MAVPKGKQSKSRTNSRFANYKATAPTLVECPHCHSMMQAHRVCANCGYYDKVEVVAEKPAKKD
ncbi:MAG TPA: 50S ribosomal protein L32 [Candidatus Coproplasma excrementigallinarum]|uniref:Large ribosomal subunit protein bL32 n=1 Tax=Candidatus Coproplasma excrementigallinarum TaxID=2840747 RepID=A0A9D1SJ30_9FIRM|nr:50S ribosomal protein L32 [Candidatus Coproplasma excrementigallinarum]